LPEAVGPSIVMTGASEAEVEAVEVMDAMQR
jgi:hypothetical protein